MYGENFPYYNSVELGRFSPLAGQEYNLVALISNTPTAYLAFNALILFAFIIIFLRVLSEFSGQYALHYFVVLLLLLMPAVTNTFFKFLYVEKNIIFYLAIFLLSFIAFQKKQKTAYFYMVLITANIAIYYKETVFIALSIFSAAHLLFTLRTSDRWSRLLNFMVILSALVYFIIYMLSVYPNIKHSYLPGPLRNSLLGFIKNIFNYGFFSDPVLILLLIPLAALRAFQIFIRKHEPHPILDPMLAAGVGYVGIFIALNMYSPYYFLPAYLFALPPMVYFFEKGMTRGFFWKGALATTAFILAVNTIPLGMHYLTYNKYLPVNFNKATDFLIKDINKRYDGHRLNIFFDGVDRGTGMGVYFVVGEFLKFKGLPIYKFDFKSDIEARDPGPFVGRRSPFDKDADINAVDPEHAYKYPDFPFAVFQPGPLHRIQKGDYLIVSPHSTKNFDDEYIEKLKNDYTLEFRTHSPFAFPRINLKTGIKYLLSKRLTEEQKASGVIKNENLLNWPDYYIFVKK